MPEIDGHLLTYTIYDHPKDNPGGYAMTCWEIHGVGPVAVWTIYQNSLDKIRAVLPPGLYCLGREPGDDPAILETWV